jgi:hypothetical protein
MLEGYFTILFKSCLIAFPLSIILFALLKFNLIKKDQPIAQDNLLRFSKKLMLYSFVAGIFTYLLTMNNTKDEHTKDGFINQCAAELSTNLSNEERNICCQLSYDYLYKKYGDKIYNDKIQLTFEDKREVVICLLKAKRPNLSDSLINVVRNKISNESEIHSAYKQFEQLKTTHSNNNYSADSSHD